MPSTPFQMPVFLPCCIFHIGKVQVLILPVILSCHVKQAHLAGQLLFFFPLSGPVSDIAHHKLPPVAVDIRNAPAFIKLSIVLLLTSFPIAGLQNPQAAVRPLASFQPQSFINGFPIPLMADRAYRMAPL